MPPARFFTKLGIFVQESFLAPEVCARVRAEMRAARASEAKVGVFGTADAVIKPDKRKTQLIDVSEETRAYIVGRLRETRLDIEQHFGLTFGTELELPKFLIYRTGDYFRAHTDRREDGVAPRVAKLRRVNLVAFLNGESETVEPETFVGGSLTLYGLLDSPGWNDCGFRVVGTPGLLVAFPSTLFHEVLPITGGERYSIVSRFLDPDPHAAAAPADAGEESEAY